MKEKENDFLVTEPIYVMGSEPWKKCSVTDLRDRLSKNPSEQTLADVYAIVCNKTAWLGDEFDENENLKDIYNEWSDFSEELIIRIEEVIKIRKLPCPDLKKTYIHRGEQFMAVYGYKDEDGWWIKTKV